MQPFNSLQVSKAVYAATVVVVKVADDNTIAAGISELYEAVEAAEETHMAPGNTVTSMDTTEAILAQLVAQWPRTLKSMPQTCSPHEATLR